MPEKLIGADPEFWLSSAILRMSGGNDFDPGARAEYSRCFSDPATIAASCADYRAAATVDLEHDDATALTAAKITCPTLVLWGDRGLVGHHYNVLDVWREYANDVRGMGLPAGHFIAEEAPGETHAALRDFLG
ncbi:Alpha/beta hydrolase family [Kibdelosporangium aridum]|uniref:Alpha/beta hydrolase family n=2 Tax=Kibdelosporangium aridum TaxID=2030 RepID=A0A1W2FMW1_KIBAR|nr:Alpha/beta hydrolase family [Kibdelosporangium aridum]